MNTDFVSYLQQRIDEATKKLQAVNEQIQKLNTDRENLVGDIDGYKRTLVAETRGTAIHTMASTSASVPAIDEIKLDARPNKAEFARQFVRGRVQFGVTPGDIFQGFHDSGIKITKPYVYSILQRLRTQGEIRQKRGKWFPVLESDEILSPNGRVD